jgi:protein ImuB
MPFTCIYVPNFSIAAALRAEPELQTHALALFEGKPPLEQIIAVNEKSRELGISPGMSNSQAELCSEIALRPRSPLQESAAHAALLDCAQSFSPVVEDTAHDTVLLDLAGMESLFGSLTKISHEIFDRAVSLGLSVNVATASNPDTALLAARGFSRVTVIPAGKEAEKLGALLIDVLFDENLETDQKEEAARLLETLARWGIRNLRALAALPEVSLSERLGQQGLHLQKLARGSATRTLLSSIEAPLVFEEAIELEHPIVLLEPLAFLLNRLLEQLCARLGSRALATQELCLTLELSNLTGIEDEFENPGMPSESDGATNTNKKWSAPFLADFARSGNFQPHTAQKAGRQSRPTEFIRKLSLPLPMLDAKVFLKLLQLPS